MTERTIILPPGPPGGDPAANYRLTMMVPKRRYLSYLRERWWVVMLCLALLISATVAYETVRTPKDLLAIYAWAATQDWFLRSADDDQAMRTADRAARSRIVAPKVTAAP